MKKELIKFQYFKNFSEFLLQHHLEDFVKKDLERAKQYEVPLLKFFEHLPYEDLYALSKKGVVKYLEDIIQGNALEAIEQSNKDWRNNSLPGISQNQIVASDITLIYNVRKHVLFDFLPLYTDDMELIINLVKEIEDFYSYQMELGFNTLAELNNIQIQNSETRLKEAQSLANLGYWDFDVEASQIKWSEQLYDIYEIERFTPLTIELIQKYVAKQESEMLIQKCLEVYTNGGKLNFEYQLITTSGKIKYLSDTAYLDISPSGNKIVKGISQDITERKNAEQQLRTREAQLIEAQALAQLGSWEWDVPTGKVSWSDEMYRLFGYQPNEIDMTYEIYISHIFEADKEVVQTHIQNCFHQLTPYNFEHRIIRKDGRMVWILGKGRVTQLQDDMPFKLSGTAMDITERKNADVALEERQQALELSNKELEAFCYTISHDLRSPLRAIDGFSGMLTSQYSDKLEEEGNRLLSIVRTNAQQMSTLIECLLNFSRLNKSSISTADLIMEDMIQKILVEYRQQFPEHNAEVTINETLHAAHGDWNLLQIVWNNLISNAIKFSSYSKNPTVEIGSKEAGEFIEYYIKDNGAGFDMAYQDKLFGVFQRLHSQSEFSGTGIGLATVYRIIQKHGGNVWAEGEVGKGATFYFTLPI